MSSSDVPPQKAPSPTITDSGHGVTIPYAASNLSVGFLLSPSSLPTQREPLSSALLAIQQTPVSQSH